MRIRAGTPAGVRIRMVWHCVELKRLLDVMWADDVMMQYCRATMLGDVVVQAKKIVITAEIVFIDPADDEPVTQQTMETEIA